jgi:integrating conjugative element protein (TIGR03761 family)
MVTTVKAAETVKKSVARGATFDSELFDDGYDIAKERRELADLLQRDDLGEADPRFQRVIELDNRERELRTRASTARLRNHADPVVDDGEAQKLTYIGRLVKDEGQQMLLHTKEAYRLFMGREAGAEQYGAVSGKRVAASLREVFTLSGNDNPYADWALLNFESDIKALRQSLTKHIDQGIAVLEAAAKRGLNYTILKSREPAKLEMGFTSPYGFMLAELLVDFDYYSRIVKTMVSTDKMSRREGSEAFFTHATRPARSLFEQFIPHHRMLIRDEIKALSRSDFSSNDEKAIARAKAAVALIGPCPRDVFTGENAPRHSKRRSRLSAEELQQLNAANLDANIGSADEGLL